MATRPILQFDSIVPSSHEMDNVVWYWDDCETAELSFETFAGDWNSGADIVWDTV